MVSPEYEAKQAQELYDFSTKTMKKYILLTTWVSCLMLLVIIGNVEWNVTTFILYVLWCTLINIAGVIAGSQPK